ncbi:hypothetical protein HTZ84_15300 [Haloterrigena sp. SYSU A558-1]|uniref:Uncharacterized protein n=1 Tax=Haloterrigena gelatinilytica TaxID=2741724 RepID=A0A8J8KDU1_9EURY|nr:hypothetical protein [Haloterrigena gelatinilytica]NUB90538.1 hypothetical protein [Haloterrigena gelatinilytica]NUC73651.1 hypothetical protein [Haloterrigena gelatinilytica]
MIGTSSGTIDGLETLRGATAAVASEGFAPGRPSSPVGTSLALESSSTSQPGQVSVDSVGGSTPVVLAAIVTFLVATVLAVLVTYRFVEGYRRTKARPILWLAVGMFLLAPGPMFLRLLAGNVAAIPLSAQLLVTTLSELCGLLAILYAVYTT